MSITEIIKLLVPIVGPVLVGTLTAGLASSFTSARRLRGELAADVELASHLPSDNVASKQLSKDIEQRTHALVAATRYRVVAPRQVTLATCVVGFFVLAFATIAYSGEFGRTLSSWHLGVLLVLVLLALIAEHLFVSDVFYALSQRVSYMHGHIRGAAPREFYDVAYVPVLIFRALTAFVAFIGLLPLWIFEGSESPTWLALAIGVPAAHFLCALARRPRISPGLKAWYQVGQDISDAPRNRSVQGRARLRTSVWGPRSSLPVNEGP